MTNKRYKYSSYSYMESSHKGVILNKNQQLINKKSELTSTCRHQNKLLLKCCFF